MPGGVQKLPVRVIPLLSRPAGEPWSKPTLPAPGALPPIACWTGELSPDRPSPKRLQIIIKPLPLWPKTRSGPLRSLQVSHLAHCYGCFLDFSISQHPPRSIAAPCISHPSSRATTSKEKSPYLERFLLLLHVGQFWFSKRIFIIGDRLTKPR